MSPEAENALDKFDAAYHLETLREGWILSETSHDTIQCQRIDNPDEWVEDDSSQSCRPAQLASDEDAWRIVINGTLPHHAAARRVLESYAPEEYALMLKLKQ